MQVADDKYVAYGNFDNNHMMMIGATVNYNILKMETLTQAQSVGTVMIHMICAHALISAK